MTEPEFAEAIAAELQEEPADVTMDTKLTDLAGWDSLSMLGVVAMIDQEYGVIIEVEKLERFKVVRDIFSAANQL